LKKSSHALPQRAPVDSIQIGSNSSPLASHAALYLVSFPDLASKERSKLLFPLLASLDIRTWLI
jgi:hypothetical protein